MMAEWIVSDVDLGCDGAYFNYTEVLRCKDCKHRFESMTIKAKDKSKFQIGHYCKATGQIVNDDDFCAWAERKTE